MKKIIILSLVLSFTLIIFAGPFTDVEKDHWAYDAINELIEKGYMGGYPDGTFKGDSALNRYEMSVIVAKILDKVNDVQTAGGFIDAKEAATIRKLATEFNDELESLGIRIGTLEERVQKLEDNHNSLKKTTEQFKIYGSYYSSQKLNIEDTVAGDSKGFVDPYHEVTLELLSKPSDISEFYMKMENGMTDIGSGISIGDYKEETVATYEVTVPGGGTVEVKDTVKYISSIDEDLQNRLEIVSLHYKLNTPRANFRFFMREGLTNLTDPIGLLSRIDGHTYLGGGRDGSGVEMSGQLNKDTSYFTSLFRHYDYDPGYVGDIFTLRTVYKVPSAVFPEASLNIGAYYLQNFNKDFGTDFDSDIIKGVDIEVVKNDKYNFSSTLNIINTETVKGDGIADENHKAIKLDASYKMNSLSSNIQYYNLDQGFKLVSVPAYYFGYRNRTFSDRSEWIWKWGDAYEYGERFFEMKNSYDMDFGNNQNANINFGYLKMWWDREDADLTQWYNHDASKFNLDIYGTFSDKFKVDILNSIVKDPKAEEKGAYKNEIKFKTSLKDANGTKVDVGVWSEKDNDNKNLAGDTDRATGMWGSVSWNATDTIYTKVGFDYGKDKIGWDSVNSSDPEYRWWKRYLETSIDLAANLSWENNYYYKQSGTYGDVFKTTQFFKTVASVSFTDRLKGRFGYWWWNKEDDPKANHTYMDVSYIAENNSKVQLIYSPSWNSGYNGFDITNIDDGLNYETNKQFKLTVSGNF